MPLRLCQRCHADLPFDDTGDLTYCPHCGAAQIALSEELREQFEQQQLAAQRPLDGSTPGTLPPEASASAPDPTAVVWARAFQLIAFTGALFAVVALFSTALPPLILVVLLWLLGAPIILLGIYCAKNPATRVTTGFGARLGLLSGLFTGTLAIAANTVIMLVQRFVLHQGAMLDSQYAASMAQTQSRLAQLVPTDPAAVQQTMQMLAVPEFHAGAALLGCVVAVVLYGMYSAAAGAFAGLLRSRAATRPAPRQR